MEENNINTDNEMNENNVDNQIVDISNSLMEAKGLLNKKLSDRSLFATIFLFSSAFIAANHLGILNNSLWFLVPAYILAIIFLMAFMGTNTGEVSAKIEILENLIKYYRGIPSLEDKTYFDSLVEINVSNLDAYYNLVKTHTKRSFTCAVLVGIIGFAMLCFGIGMLYKEPDKSQLAYISSSSGIITEFISGVFFYLYNKTVRQLKDYHDSLLDVQNILLSFKLIETTKNEEKRSQMTDKMIEFLVGMKKNNKTSTNDES